jgi:hypothetical protein
LRQDARLGLDSGGGRGGRGLALGPIIIHIIFRRRYRVLDFAAMRFLLEGLKKRRQRLRLEELVIIARRVLACLRLGLALANMRAAAFLAGPGKVYPPSVWRVYPPGAGRAILWSAAARAAALAALALNACRGSSQSGAFRHRTPYAPPAGTVIPRRASANLSSRGGPSGPTRDLAVKSRLSTFDFPLSSFDFALPLPLRAALDLSPLWERVGRGAPVP